MISGSVWGANTAVEMAGKNGGRKRMAKQDVNK